MAGIEYYSIQEIPDIGDKIQIILIGTVTALFRQQKFLTFNISDATATAEATYFQDKYLYEKISNIPNIGDTIQIFGTCSTKPFANNKDKKFLKVKIQRWRVLTFDQQLKCIEKVINSRSKRSEKKINDEVVVAKKKIRVKQKIFSEKQLVDVRSLVFSYMYIVFKNNKDINTYIFVPQMIRAHSLYKEYITKYQVPDKSMQEALRQSLVYLLAHQVIQQKQQKFQQTPAEQYIIKKVYFEKLVSEVVGYIFEKQQTGTTLEMVTKDLNNKLGKQTEESYLFNWMFVQKVLVDLINEHRIYKTGDKILYPNRL